MYTRRFAQIVFIVLIFHIATTSGSLDLSRKWKNTSWNVFNPNTDYFYRHISENIFAGEKSHVIAYASWDDYSNQYPTSYNLTVLTHLFDGQTFINDCNLETPSNQAGTNTSQLHRIVVLKENRILVTWSKPTLNGDPMSVSQVIFVDTCQKSNFIQSGRDLRPWILQYKNTFDMVLHDKEFCSNNNYCKLSFNYDGELLLSKSKTFSIFTQKEGDQFVIKGAYAMNYNNSGEGFILIANRLGSKLLDHGFMRVSEDIYTPILGWIKAPKLNPRFSWYSNSSGFATLCWRINLWDELYCQRLDGTGGKNALKFDMNLRSASIVKVHNKPDGHILLLSELFKGLTIDEAYENGKCKRFEIIYDVDSPQNVEISIVNEKQYCLSMITLKLTSIDYYERPSMKYDFITKCATMPDLNNKKFISCAK